MIDFETRIIIMKVKGGVGVAQLAERLICNQQVAGSSPATSSIKKEGYPSGQRGRTVNPLAQPSEVQILPPPP